MAGKINKNAKRLIDEAFMKMPSPWREICIRLRELVHAADPEIVEDWKWGPNFNKNGMVCNVWGFKSHASLVFFRGSLMKDGKKLFNYGENNKASRMIKFTDMKQVQANEKNIIAYIREAVKINSETPVTVSKINRTIELPELLEKWFARNRKARAFFDSLSYTHRKEMIVAITSAKKEETRERRFKAVTEALKEGRKTV